jgi:hypothetical protein
MRIAEPTGYPTEFDLRNLEITILCVQGVAASIFAIDMEAFFSASRTVCTEIKAPCLGGGDEEKGQKDGSRLHV